MNAPITASPTKKSELLSIPFFPYENPYVIAVTPMNETTRNIISTVLNFSPVHIADIIIVAIGERFLAPPWNNNDKYFTIVISKVLIMPAARHLKNKFLT